MIESDGEAALGMVVTEAFCEEETLGFDLKRGRDVGMHLGKTLS